ncbi:MAG: RNA polymerase subunit sigma-24 [Deltaproteobacteria bacterium]|nr:MAG: RNA polymerase subunit sigma-24 [Deltaproteobacteria bacterium]
MNVPDTQLETDDAKWIGRVLSGDADAFAPLMKKYEARVFRILQHHLPADAVEETAQDVFIRAYQSLKSLRDRNRFRPWLTSIAVRTCYDYWRRHYRNREVTLSSLTDRHQHWLEHAMTGSSDDAFETRLNRKESREILEWLLLQLSPNDRMVVSLMYLEERSVRETAGLMGWSIANVKVRAFRVRKKLTRLLQEQMA